MRDLAAVSVHALGAILRPAQFKIKNQAQAERLRDFAGPPALNPSHFGSRPFTVHVNYGWHYEPDVADE
jgi:hypothetical protein